MRRAGQAYARAIVLALACPALAACGDGGTPLPEGMTQEEQAALDDAASMLDDPRRKDETATQDGVADRPPE